MKTCRGGPRRTIKTHQWSILQVRSRFIGGRMGFSARTTQQRTSDRAANVVPATLLWRNGGGDHPMYCRLQLGGDRALPLRQPAHAQPIRKPLPDSGANTVACGRVPHALWRRHAAIRHQPRCPPASCAARCRGAALGADPVAIRLILRAHPLDWCYHKDAHVRLFV